MIPDPTRRPGDLLIDHFFPDADEQTRERARDMLRAWAAFLIRMGDRLVPSEDRQEDSPELPRRPTI
jgi:hypothetical protein